MFVDVIVLEPDVQDALLTRLRLRRVPGVRCRVRHLTSLVELPRAVEFCNPALVVMDILLPEVWGTLAASRVQAIAPWVPLVVQTAFQAPGLAAELDRLGLAARLDKSDAGYAALPAVVGEIVRSGPVGSERVRPWPLSA